MIKFRIINKSKKLQESGKTVNLKDYNNISFYKNKIVVAKEVTPLESPYLFLSKGIIIENGSLLCHIAIFSRELDLFVIQVEDISKIPLNKKINVNFKNLTISIIKKKY
jgi:phosphoenolpyruvate-protein kinase (PTS system EI component)